VRCENLHFLGVKCPDDRHVKTRKGKKYFLEQTQKTLKKMNHTFNFNLVVPCLVSFCTQKDEIVPELITVARSTVNSVSKLSYFL